MAHLESIKRSICLRSRRTHGGSSRPIQKTKLYARAIDDPPHDSPKCIDLADQVTFSDSANGWIAGHLSYQIQVKREKRRSRPNPGCGRCGLTSSVTSTYHDHIKCLIENHKEFSLFGMLTKADSHLPMQNVEKIRPRISSVVVSPVISPKSRSAL
jgi:hypothetical protein